MYEYSCSRAPLFAISLKVLIPYIHTSMGGTNFSVAQFSKQILCTDTGVLIEYLEPSVNSIVCENGFSGIRRFLERILNMSDVTLREMGYKLNENIIAKCD